MLWRRQNPVSTIEDVVEVLEGIGQILMAVDAKLGQLVDILRGEDDEEVDT